MDLPLEKNIQDELDMLGISREIRINAQVTFS